MTPKHEQEQEQEHAPVATPEAARPRPLPTIGVVVPSMNQVRFLREALESLFRQSYPKLEVVVMDGGSTDGSLDVIRAFEDRLAYWQSQPDGGQARAIEEGVRKLSSTLVAWLNSDDFHTERALWTVARAYQRFPEHGLYVGNGFRYSQATDELVPFCRRHIALDRDALVRGLDYLLQPSVFFLRRAWSEVGGLDPDLRYCMDWDLLIRIAERHPAVLINEFLAASREYEETKTASGGMERAIEIDRMIRSHSGGVTTPGSLYYLFETLLSLPVEAAPEGLRKHSWEAMKVLQEGFAREHGHSDAFPDRIDPRDRVFLDFPTSGRADERAPTDEGGPSISVVIPSFQQARFLERTLESVLDQHYPALEVIVMDGGSTDGSVGIIERHAPRLSHWVSERDAGPADAVNEGLSRATGEILGWLNSDDVLSREALAEVGRAFAADPELDLVYGNALYIDERDRLHIVDHGWQRTAFYRGEMQPVDAIPLYWTYVHAVPQPTVYFRRRLLERCGRLDESYKFIFDFELFYRFAREARVRKLERTLAFYRIHQASKTGSGWRSFQVELYRFSRPLWPSRLSPRFYETWKSFVAIYMRDRFWGHPRDLRFWAVATLAGLASFTGIGNPESWTYAPGLGAPAARSPLPIARPAPRREGAAPKVRSVFCSFLWPRHPGQSGGEIRDYHLLKHIAGWSAVDVVALQPEPADAREDLATRVEAIHGAESLAASFPERVHAEAGRPSFLARLGRRLRRLGLPVPCGRYHAEVEERLPHLRAHFGGTLEALLDRAKPDYLFVSPQSSPIALLLQRVPSETKLILATYDVEAVRVERLERSGAEPGLGLVGRSEARRAERFERENLAKFDGVIAVSELDKSRLHDRYGFPEDRILVLDNGVDVDYFSFCERNPSSNREILFVSSLAYAPNREAALRLIRRILPAVRKRDPGARLTIVGRGADASLAAAAEGQPIEIAGAVADVRPYLERASLACIPLSTGSGTKYKVLEALSAGVPVVCTSVAAEGLDVEDGVELLIRDSDDAVAAAVCDLLEEPQRAVPMARAGRALIERRYSWEAILPKLEGWLEGLS